MSPPRLKTRRKKRPPRLKRAKDAVNRLPYIYGRQRNPSGVFSKALSPPLYSMSYDFLWTKGSVRKNSKNDAVFPSRCLSIRKTEWKIGDIRSYSS